MIIAKFRMDEQHMIQSVYPQRLITEVENAVPKVLTAAKVNEGRLTHPLQPHNTNGERSSRASCKWSRLSGGSRGDDRIIFGPKLSKPSWHPKHGGNTFIKKSMNISSVHQGSSAPVNDRLILAGTQNTNGKSYHDSRKHIILIDK